MPVRVCHVVSSLQVGGLERMVLDLCRGQAALGVDVTILVLGPDRGSGARDPGVRIVHPPALARLPRLADGCGIARLLWLRPDVIHAHNLRAARVARAACRLRRRWAAFVYTWHGRGFPAATDAARVNALRRRCAARAARIVCVSRNTAAFARQIVGPAIDIAIVPNGVDVRRFAPQGDERRTAMRERFGITDPAVVVGSVGRLAVEKNYALLIRAVADRMQDEASPENARTPISPALPDGVRLLLVGDGPERHRLEALARTCGIGDRVVFAGMQDDPQAAYAAMDLFCLSSNTEGTPLALLEAGACGCPAVVTDVGGNAEVVVDGETGRVVPPENPAALRAAIAGLAESAALRRRFGAAARRRIERHYSLETMVAAYADVYRDALEDPR